MDMQFMFWKGAAEENPDQVFHDGEAIWIRWQFFKLTGVRGWASFLKDPVGGGFSYGYVDPFDMSWTPGMLWSDSVGVLAWWEDDLDFCTNFVPSLPFWYKLLEEEEKERAWFETVGLAWFDTAKDSERWERYRGPGSPDYW